MTTHEPITSLQEDWRGKIKIPFNFIKNFAVWSFPTKLAVAAIVGALGGSSLVGVLSEYATYSYAIYFGIRPPIEGIPYLKASVTASSLIVLLTGAFIFVLVTAILKLFRATCIWFSDRLRTILRKLATSSTQRTPASIWNKNLADSFRNTKLWLVALIAIPVGVACGGLIYLIHFIVNTLGFTPIPADKLRTISLIYSIFGTVAFTALAKPHTLWWIAISATLTNFLAWVVLLFSPTAHSQILRIIGYGGGLPVSIELRDVSDQEKPMDKTQYLILRTTEALIVLNDSTNEFIEIPRDQIKNIRHRVGGLDNLAFYLPNTQQQVERAR